MVTQMSDNELVFCTEENERKVLTIRPDGSMGIAYEYYRDGQWQSWQDMGASLTADEVDAIVALKTRQP